MEVELLIAGILVFAFLFYTSAQFRWRKKTYITAMAVIAVITMLYFETGIDTQLP